MLKYMVQDKGQQGKQVDITVQEKQLVETKSKIKSLIQVENLKVISDSRNTHTHT